MTLHQKFLVVGGDSLVGNSVVQALQARGHVAFSTTRRQETVDETRVFLDFESQTPFIAPLGMDYAFIIAAATNYDRCENDPLARIINVEHIPRLVKGLLQQGVFVTFISTNSVFGGDHAWPQEDDPHAPGIAYALQKTEGEAVIVADAARLNATHLLNITRLTKILAPDTSPIPAWSAAFTSGKTVEPFEDLIFAPMSVNFVGEALATIGEKRVAGNLHLSGAANVSYVEFAHAIAQRLGADEKLIAPTTSVAKDIHIAFKPRFSGLGMARTTALTGVEPQPLSRVIADIFPPNTPQIRT